MNNKIKLLDVVALVDDMPEYNLRRGQVGAVVEILAPDVCEVEFVDKNGCTYAELAINEDKLLVLHYEPVLA